MNQIRVNSIRFVVSRGVYVYFALLMLLIPFRLLFAAAVSAAVHELFHIAVIYIMRIRIHSVKISIGGAKIETDAMEEKQELLCAMAGPVGGLLLLLLFRWIPVIALTGAIQSLYNLLPMHSTDGGRILRCGTKLLFSDKVACKVTYATEMFTLSAIVALCVYGSICFHLGILPIMLAAGLLLRSAKGNNSCKA